MTVYSDLSRVRYVANGQTTEFSVPFPYMTNNDGTAQLSVFLDDSDTPLLEGKDYYIVGIGNYNHEVEQDEGLIVYEERFDSGIVIFYSAPAKDKPIAIIRNVNLIQGIQFINGEEFPAEDFSNALDKLTMAVQELKENQGRSVILPPTSNEKPIEVRDNIIQAANVAINTAEEAIKLISNAPEIIASETETAINNIEEFANQKVNSFNSIAENVQNEVVTNVEKSRIWAEGEPAEVETLGGILSSMGAADLAYAIANNPENTPIDVSNLMGVNVAKEENDNKNNIYSAYHYACKTKADREAIENIVPEVINTAKRATFGNIGDIKYTIRKDVPNGGFWCDGSIKAKQDLPNIYQMLLDNKFQYVTITEYEQILAEKGSCGFLGLDITNECFRLPLLNDIFIKTGQEAEVFGAESLPNITGTWDCDGLTDVSYGENVKVSGALYSFTSTQSNNADGFSSGKSAAIGIDASLSSSTYQDGAKVNPDYVKYRAYIILYTTEKELSIVNWKTELTRYTEKLKEDLLAFGTTTITYWE